MHRRTMYVILAMLLVATLIVSGCTKNDSGDKATASSSAPAANSPSKDAASPGSSPAGEQPDPLGKYPEPVKVTQVLGYLPPTDPTTPSGITPDKNAYLKDLKEQLNIDLSYLWAVPFDQFDQKFSISIASGDLPDIMTVDRKTFEKFKEQGILADLTDAFNNYALDEVKDRLKADNGFAMQTASSDGKLLGIPDSIDPYMNLQLLYVRKDWLDHLGLKAPTTIDELEKVAEAFTTGDPDGNGKNDTYGIALQKSPFLPDGFDTKAIFNGFGAYPQGWVKGSDGNLVAGETMPEAKDALARMQSWYQKGILDKEFAFKDENKVVEDITAGKVGITYGQWWTPAWPLNLALDNNPNADWVALQIPGIDGPGNALVGRVNVSSIIVVNKKFKHPEAAIKMINYYRIASDEAHFELTKPADGYVNNWYAPRIGNLYSVDTTFEKVNAALDAKQETIDVHDSSYKDVGGAFTASKKYLAGDKSGWGVYYSRPARDGGWGTTRKVRESGAVVYNEFYGPPTSTQLEKGAQIDKLVEETFTKIIMGAPLTDFDKFVTSWKSLGGDAITQEVNDWYRANAL